MIPFLRRHLRAAHGLVKRAPRELSVALVGDAKMAALHERFLGIPGPTDVLTFEMEHDKNSRVVSGEIVICVPQARRNAKAPSRLRQEVLLYVIHGLLHLCGFDDRTQRGFAAMHRAEDKILSRIGVGRVFGLGADR